MSLESVRTRPGFVYETRLFDFCQLKVDVNNTHVIEQQYDGYGNHRLAFFDYNGNALFSKWQSHQYISKLTVKNVGQFIGTSDYYDGVLPRVFQLVNPLKV